MGSLIHYNDIGQLLTMKGAYSKKGRNIDTKDLGVVSNGSLVVKDGQIVWSGRTSQLPNRFQGTRSRSLAGKNVFPGFVDCHTHFVFAGDRIDEFEQRNRGVSYHEIAKRGGGIRSTVKATRKASLKTLQAIGQMRVRGFVDQGVTTLEGKSGYGLQEKTELRILRSMSKLEGTRIVPTYLGAHGVPEAFGSAAKYLESLESSLKKVKNEQLSHRVDIFVEKGYFSVKESRSFLKLAQKMGFDLTLHSDQLSRTGATGLAVELGALSADHVICLNEKDKDRLASSETTAVLLPSADFYIHCPYPDARGLLDRGARCALATDFNPGSSPTQSIAFVGLLARLKMKMTLPEVFSAFTVGGACALGGQDSYGALVPGLSADFFTTTGTWKEFFYDVKNPTVDQVWVRGKKV